jgi:hypothetical protein
MKKEIEYEMSCDRIAAIFSGLTDIIKTIKEEFEQESAQDPQLTIEIVNSRLKMVSFNAKSFLGYKERMKTEWSLEKYIQYSRDSLHSFFREFDNPFSGSQK